ncbi:hypothetical protein [Sinomonas mesophila]|uniref:hypothetical protein n=1 Tax=Sinomonas mesophila TaxID=1531955 RepID=UPI001115823D|nr:hypothetical protein [Sinomonas mesophila]
MGEPLPPAEWASLTRNERITLQRGAARVAGGTVDLVADDGSIFWVHLDNGVGRVAIHVDDDATVWRA